MGVGEMGVLGARVCCVKTGGVGVRLSHKSLPKLEANPSEVGGLFYRLMQQHYGACCVNAERVTLAPLFVCNVSYT